MSGVALIARFDGDPDDLIARFRAAARRYADTPGSPDPSAAVLLRNPRGIVAILAWPEGVSLQPFRGFLLNAIDELGLPHPRVEHMRADADAWLALTRPESPDRQISAPDTRPALD